MNFKSLILGLLITTVSVSVFAQKYNVSTAKAEYDSYALLKSGSPALALPKIQSAKEAIDKAVVHQKTSTDPTAWAYKALIYADMASSDSTGASESLMNEAIVALAKAKELDKEGKNKEDIDKATTLLYVNKFNTGKDYFDKKDYKNAYTEFRKGLDINPGDTLLNYAAAIAAMNQKDYPNAIGHFKELLPTNYSQLETVYSNLSILYATVKDTVNAIKIAGEGSAKFPNNTVLPVSEIELSLMSGREKEIISKISAQAERNPGNKLFPYYLGMAYASVKDNVKAEESYKKAIAIDPFYKEAIINISGVIMNNGIELYNKANKIPQSKAAEYNAMKKKALAEFDRALPYLNKAVELDPESKLALINLKRYYQLSNNTAKIAELDAKINAL